MRLTRRRPSPCARPPSETFREFLVPRDVAFGEVWAEDEIENETEMVEIDRIVGAFEGDLAVGVSGAFSFRMTTPGGRRSAPPGSPSSACCRPIGGAGSSAR